MTHAGRVLIFGVTGQDGAYLSKSLIDRGYCVQGTTRSTNDENLWRLKALGIDKKIGLYDCGLSDFDQIRKIISETQPDFVYNLAAVSSLGEAFEDPDGTMRVNADAVEVIISSLFSQFPEARFFQASSAQIFGEPLTWPQTEESIRAPQSPYAEAKIRADEAVANARKQGFFAVSGILYNHESPLRSGRFVSRKIAEGLVRYSKQKTGALKLGTLNAERDWCFAGDVMSGAILALSHSVASDYIFASGKSHRVRDWVEIGAIHLGLVLYWEGEGLNEIAIDRNNGHKVIEIDPAFYRESDPAKLVGFADKARQELGWTPEFQFSALVRLMIDAELARYTD